MLLYFANVQEGEDQLEVVAVAELCHKGTLRDHIDVITNLHTALQPPPPAVTRSSRQRGKYRPEVQADAPEQTQAQAQPLWTAQARILFLRLFCGKSVIVG